MLKTAISLGIAGLVTLLLGTTISAWRTEHIQNAPLLAVNFAHKDHTEQNCLACHHNYTDDTGNLPCIECHKTDPEVAPLIEEQFHDYCRGCHVDKQLQGEPSGPVRECYACHQLDPFP